MPGDPFRTRDHVSDFDAVVADIVSRSEATRTGLPMVADVAYGDGPFETLDLFFPEKRKPNMPIHMFIHGGYWRMFSKRDFSCVAQTVTGAGAIAAIFDYALMPAVSMAVIVDQVRRARNWLVEHVGGYGGDPSRLTVSGHSAGAHLCTFLFHDGEAAPPRAALLLGGLYDLKPLQSSFLKTEIEITDEDVRSFTPMDHRYNPAVTVTILVGAEETPPFHEQARKFAAVLEGQGVQVENSTLLARNHMNSVRDLGVPGTDAANHLKALIETT